MQNQRPKTSHDVKLVAPQKALGNREVQPKEQLVLHGQRCPGLEVPLRGPAAPVREAPVAVDHRLVGRAAEAVGQEPPKRPQLARRLVVKAQWRARRNDLVSRAPVRLSKRHCPTAHAVQSSLTTTSTPSVFNLREKRLFMAKKSDLPNDYRSESERVRNRPDGAPPEREHSRGGRTPKKVTDPDIEASAVTKTTHAHRLDSSPDQLLKQGVIDTLASEPELRTADLTVDVQNGVVFLTGTVDTVNTKFHAEHTAKRVHGVNSVENHLKIRVGNALDEFTRGSSGIRRLH